MEHNQDEVNKIINYSVVTTYLFMMYTYFSDTSVSFITRDMRLFVH